MNSVVTGEVCDGARGELELVAGGARGQRQQRRQHAARARHRAGRGVPEALHQVPHQREVEVRPETDNITSMSSTRHADN